MSRLMIIPAAGRGSRLDLSIPKLLVPVNGRPMIDHLLDLYRESVDRFVVVVHPDALDRVQHHCRSRDESIGFAVQAFPTGMLDALLEARDEVLREGPASVWVTWCDQVAVHPDTVRALDELSRTETAALILPVARPPSPYTCLLRDPNGRIVGVLNRREADDMPEHGESEMGLFALSLEAYAARLPEFGREVAPGAATRERNFLPFIPWLAARDEVRTFPCVDWQEAIGVNTADDLALVSAYLRSRASQSPGDART
jgi:bifunctional N-acetylglucosamine-1-phosphate-uridyltransferase/glucosamine-1-phosphate-acetyltransferase GlmU-like protein